MIRKSYSFFSLFYFFLVFSIANVHAMDREAESPACARKHQKTLPLAKNLLFKAFKIVRREPSTFGSSIDVSREGILLLASNKHPDYSYGSYHVVHISDLEGNIKKHSETIKIELLALNGLQMGSFLLLEAGMERSYSTIQRVNV